jgi:hypothetical protein
MIWSNSKDAQLKEAIVCKADAGEILDLYRRVGSGWQIGHMVTALHRVAKYPGGRSVADDQQVWTLVAQVGKSAEHCNAQQLANSAWACAKMSYLHVPFLAAIEASSLSIISSFKAQELANTAWSLSRLVFAPAPLRNAISSAAIPLSHLGMQTQSLANLSWAWARLNYVDLPLFDAIAAASIPSIHQF